MTRHFFAPLACALLPFTSPAETTSAPNPAGAGLAAAREQVRKLVPGAGLEVSVFAAEPMLVNPANLDVDARGRVWVTEGANYRLWQKWGKLRPEGDRIVIMEDTDGDGAADKATTFYQGNDINSALGICVLGNKVIVSCAPNVFVFTDDNGDDKADREGTPLHRHQGRRPRSWCPCLGLWAGRQALLQLWATPARRFIGPTVQAGQGHGRQRRDRKRQTSSPGHDLPLQPGRQRLRSAGL